MKYAIIGGGIGGLCTALAFHKQGTDFQLFEKAPKISEVGAGIWLAPNALQVLDQLGVLQNVKEAGNSINRITVGKADLSPISDNFQDNIKSKFGFSTIAIHRAKLQKILLESLPSEMVTLGKEFQSYKTLANGKVEIQFKGQSTYSSDYLIGADGIHSRVRKQLFPESELRFSGQTCWRGVAPINLDKGFANRGIELWGNRVRFGISKIAENQVYWFAVALSEANLEDDKSALKNKLMGMYSKFNPMVLKIIEATPEDKIMRNDIIDLKPLMGWHKDTICLIGDAGHATTPNMGQGGAQAIEDAFFIAKTIKTSNSENAFKHFQEMRYKKVNSIVSQSWNTGKIAHLKYGRGLRNFILKSIPAKLMEKKMMEMYQLK